MPSERTCARCLQPRPERRFYRGDKVCIPCRDLERWRRDIERAERGIERLEELKADRERKIAAAKGAAR